MSNTAVSEASQETRPYSTADFSHYFLPPVIIVIIEGDSLHTTPLRFFLFLNSLDSSMSSWQYNSESFQLWLIYFKRSEAVRTASGAPASLFLGARRPVSFRPSVKRAARRFRLRLGSRSQTRFCARHSATVSPRPRHMAVLSSSASAAASRR